MRRTWLGFLIATVASGTLMVTVMACGNDANDVTACQTLEFARCDHAQACGIDLSYPLGTGNTLADQVTSCQLFYEDACLHGLVTSYVPTSKQVTACVDEINSGNCQAVINPQEVAACTWLNPPDAGVDAGTTTDAAVTTDVTIVVAVDSTVTTTTDAEEDSGVQSCINQCTLDDCATGDSLCDDNCVTTCEGM